MILLILCRILGKESKMWLAWPHTGVILFLSVIAARSIVLITTGDRVEHSNALESEM